MNGLFYSIFAEFVLNTSSDVVKKLVWKDSLTNQPGKQNKSVNKCEWVWEVELDVAFILQDGARSGCGGEERWIQPPVRHLGCGHHLNRAGRAPATHVRPPSNEVSPHQASGEGQLQDGGAMNDEGIPLANQSVLSYLYFLCEEVGCRIGVCRGGASAHEDILYLVPIQSRS